MQMSSVFPPIAYKFHILEKKVLVNPQALTAQKELHIDIHEIEEKIHDQFRSFLQAKNKLGPVFMGSHIEILGDNCQ